MRFLLPVVFALQGTVVGQTVSSELKKGTQEWGLQTGGGVSIAGGARGDRSYWLLAGRWSRIMTEDLGSGPLRGNLQYGVEVYPAMVVSQTNTVFAGGFSPLQLRYNFTAGQRIAPFIEIGGGILGSTRQLPEGTSRFNFLTQGGIGVQVFRSQRPAVQLGIRYQHISNAGLAQRNPGINALYFFAGASWWR